MKSAMTLGQAAILWREGALTGLTDAELLQRFLTVRGEVAEAAFAVIVQRHGAMVLGVCRRVLKNAHDAEDVFQATFLALVKQAGSVRVDDSLGRWLNRVSYRMAHRANAAAHSRKKHERASYREQVERPDGGREMCEIRATLNDELSRLPEKYRAPLEVCYLEGMTHEEAARTLGWPLGTVRGRLARGRDRLRERLARRGFGAAILGAAETGLRSELRVALVNATARAAARLQRGTAMSAVVSASVCRLVAGAVSPAGSGRVFAVVACTLVPSMIALAALMNGDPPSTDSPPNEVRSAVVALPAPREVGATYGRGSIMLYERDDAGNRVELPKRGVLKDGFFERRWVVVAGVIDHKALRTALARSQPGRVASRRVEYRRVMLERQQKGPAGDWSGWVAVDREPTDRVLEDLPESQNDRVPESLRREGLVDLLPHLRTGSWKGVDVPRLALARAGDRGGNPSRDAEPDELLIRSFDFSIQAGNSYRYRACVVVEGEVRNGRRTERQSAWSAPTNEVNVPGE